jgi:hypothetical protein
VKPAVSLLGFAACLLAGCSSFRAFVQPERDMAACRVFFVQTNLNDDRGIASSIVRALQARGRTATKGPLTMVPLEAEVIVIYEDRWAWDGKDHMTGLRIAMLDADKRAQIAFADFNGPGAVNASTDAVVERLIAGLLGPASTPPGRASTSSCGPPAARSTSRGRRGRCVPIPPALDCVSKT